MKIRAFTIGCVLAIFSTALPKSAKANTAEFWYAYTAGALAAICDLHNHGVISTSTVKEATNNFIGEYDPDIPDAAVKGAVQAIKEMDDFKNCPIQHY